MRSTMAVLVAAGVMVVMGTPPAQATVRERFSEHEDYEYVQDCGFAVEVTGSLDNAFLLREGGNQDAGAFPVLNRTAFSERWTNAETGEWFTIRGHAVFNEIGATRVEGSIFEFRAVEAGQPFVVEDSDGSIVESNSGSVHISYLFDTLGDDVPGGEWIADVGFRVAGPHPSLFADPCEYAVQLIG